MKAIVLGATGLTGSHLLDFLISDENCEEIRVFSRRKIQQNHPKIKVFIIDLLELYQHQDDFIGDVVYCCIGTTKNKTPDKTLYHQIDYGIPVTAAKLAKANGIPKFIVISSLGSNPNAKIFYSRLKGEMERDVLAQEIEETYILQPSLIFGDRTEKRIGEDFANVFMSIFGFLLPRKYKRIQAKTIAQTMWKLYEGGYKKERLDSSEIATYRIMNDKEE